MANHDRESLREAIGRFDAKMRLLADLGIDLSRPGPQLLADLRARKDEMRRQQEALEATQLEADRALLSPLLDLYRTGGDADREWLREVLRGHRTFRWGLGWSLGARIATEEDARNMLALLSM